MGQYDVVGHADSSFLQMVIWERFPSLASKPIRLPRGGHRGSDTNEQLKGDEGLTHAEASSVKVVKCETIYQ